MPSTERRPPPSSTLPALQVRGLNLYYGRSHALQGVDLTLQEGVLSLVGRNGMGKTSLCKAIMGLVPVSSGSISVFGEELVGRSTTDIARLGIGYVPQGRRLWRSLSVDEHLRLAQRGPRGSWTPARIYDTFPRLAERKNNAGSQLSGGEQQMLAISRALLLNPRLLIMDEPTEGLAPVIVAQVEDMLVRLSEEGEVAILVIEQNIGVATEISDTVAIMVNGRVNRVIEAARLAADRDLQQRLLGVGRHGHEEVEPSPASGSESGGGRPAAPSPRNDAPIRVYLSNPVLPTRWSADVAAARIEGAARTLTRHARRRRDRRIRSQSRAQHWWSQRTVRRRGRNARHQGRGAALHRRHHQGGGPAGEAGRSVDHGPDLRRGRAAAGDRAAPPARFRRGVQCRPRRRGGGDGGGV